MLYVFACIRVIAVFNNQVLDIKQRYILYKCTMSVETGIAEQRGAMEKSVDADSDVSTLFPGASGRTLQEMIWDRYVENTDQLLTKPFFTNDTRTFERHAMNDRHQQEIHLLP